MIVNIANAKARLSELINRAYQGEEIVIAKNDLPLIDLVPHKPSGKRVFGRLEGKFVTPADFLERDKAIEAMFYGDEK
jgi:prevent-host-death family protein